MSISKQKTKCKIKYDKGSRNETVEPMTTIVDLRELKFVAFWSRSREQSVTHGETFYKTVQKAENCEFLNIFSYVL